MPELLVPCSLWKLEETYMVAVLGPGSYQGQVLMEIGPKK